MEKTQVENKRKVFLTEFASNVTLHGFRYLFEQKGIRRLIWFIITTGCFSFSIVLFYSILKDFLTYKTTTATTTDYDRRKINFPTITLCPINYVSMKKLKSISNSISPKEFMSTFSLLRKEEFDQSHPNVSELLAFLKQNNISTVKEMTRLYELELPEMVDDEIVQKISGGAHYCYFERQPCTTENFTTVSTWSASLCSQFNGYSENRKVPLEVQSKGLNSGFSMTLNLHTEESIFSDYPFEGIILSVQSFGTPHQMPEYSKNIVLPTGSLSLIDISTKKVNLLPSPYHTKCGVKEYNLVKGYPYSKAMCHLDCLISFIYKECGCLGYDVEEYVDIPICGIEKLYCYLSQKDLVIHLKSSYCESNCPRECTRTEYSITHSAGNLGTYKVHHEIQQLEGWKNTSLNEIKEYIRNNLVSINIIFRDISETHETVSPAVTWTTLLGTIGGSIGLCLGFSFVTMFEFIFFIFDYLTTTSNMKVANNNNDLNIIEVRGPSDISPFDASSFIYEKSQFNGSPITLDTYNTADY